MDYLQYNKKDGILEVLNGQGFKPYYKWITFNTLLAKLKDSLWGSVLNLIINGLPSILYINDMNEVKDAVLKVLNLIINGLPSIRY